MSRKQSQKDSSGFIFDLQSNTVLAQGGVFENMKEKINAVRAIVPNKSNNEIILVLQHFDNCVDKTVQAFMEGSASEVLKEWTVTGKKKNKKKKSKPKPAAEASNCIPDSNKLVSNQEEQSAPSSEKGGINGYHVNGTINDAESVDSLSEGLETLSIDARELEDYESAMPNRLDITDSVLENGVSDFESKSLMMRSIRNAQKSRNAAKFPQTSTTGSQFSNLGMEDVPLSSTNKRLGSNIEKSVKDLQRCTVSLARYRVVVKEEMDASIKKMKQAFAELQSCLMDREVALLAEMDKVKAEAMEILLSRQKKAELLKKMTDVAVRMSEEQLVELRADIKHFVSERKYDEDLGRVARFTCDVETLKKSIDSFGQALQVLIRETLHQERLLQPQQTPAADLTSLIGRYCRGPDEDEAIGHKAKSPMTQQTKGNMTVWIITEIVRGIHLVPGIRVLHARHWEILVSGAIFTLQGPMELEPAWSLAHLSPHLKRGSLSANPGPPGLKL
ncbi:PREDICTED: spermatogenesis-associated serine-rich protein 2 isoform X2 [Dipodomys ordii]|uniref:Spermatogenesis-associated serine-rich protein 2 isoform X2 n=1 Tax=Dipodomys ordii TaxID=10020 RepID=A0A1S3FE79_DIPOR|nr:PREDICTED: spermatogenesis-associated serine-rich protein 2 isoform X2 [Dipodomys ordii]